jgi:hypothetical protein
MGRVGGINQKSVSKGYADIVTFQNDHMHSGTQAASSWIEPSIKSR